MKALFYMAIFFCLLIIAFVLGVTIRKEVHMRAAHCVATDRQRMRNTYRTAISSSGNTIMVPSVVVESLYTCDKGEQIWN